MSAGVGALLLELAFWGYGAMGPVWLLQALPVAAKGIARAHSCCLQA